MVCLQAAACFLVMTAFAQRLPVLFIPEKRMIAAMGYDMVDHGRGRQHTVLQAFGAQRTPEQKRLPCLSPACVIAPGGSTAANSVMAPFFSVIFAVNPLLAEIGTAGLAAGAFGDFRHIESPYSGHSSNKPRSLYTESPPFWFFIARSSAMTSATAPSIFSVDFSLSSFRLPAGSVRT